MSELGLSTIYLRSAEAIRMSPAHYQQIQSDRFNQIGIGVKGEYYVVILAQFDSPARSGLTVPSQSANTDPPIKCFDRGVRLCRFISIR